MTHAALLTKMSNPLTWSDSVVAAASVAWRSLVYLGTFLCVALDQGLAECSERSRYEDLFACKK